MHKIKLLNLLTILLVSSSLCAQDNTKIKFGKITPEDFKATVYEIDTSAAAVILAEIGSTEIIGNTKGSFSLLFKNFRRARVVNKNGYDIGNVSISLYKNGDAEEELENLKAVTYNLENGKVVATKLDIKDAVFKDVISKNLVVKKFTFPNIKEGSIIEYEYKIQSDFIFNLQPWNFQGEYPRLWSEYNVAMPGFYNYVNLSQGYQAFHIKDIKKRQDNFRMTDSRSVGASESGTFQAQVTDYRWVMKDVPGLKDEGFTSTLKNHIARIEFQLSSIGEPFQYRSVMGSWNGVAKQLLEDEDFGSQLKKDNGWLNDVMPLALKNAKTPLEKARNIYYWVRDNFTCTNHNRRYLAQTLKNVLKARNGNVAEINLLLAAMLNKADIEVDPVLLSTRSNGYTHTLYPLMDRFNYVINRAVVDGKEYYLDASESGLGFGKLDVECYNGHARIINAQATAIELNPETQSESKTTTIFIINDEKNNSVGSFQQTPGYFESYRLRSSIKEKGKESVFTNIKKGFGVEVTTSKERLDSLNIFEEPVGIFCDFDILGDKEDIMYINPMFGENFKENPFKSAKRYYPVEMPYAIDQTYNLQMEIPRDYVVDELPKQMVVKLNEEGDAVFEYRLSASATNISMRTRVLVKRTFYSPEEYENLREFFNLIVKKQGEQIVLKKKK